MLNLGPLAFAAPWMLLGLAVLPVIWWLLRVTPPAPRRIDFPPVRILMELRRHDETPEKTPLWLLLLRLCLAALVVLALAHPLLNPSGGLGGSGPLLLVVDDGWAAARHWSRRTETMIELVEQAARQGRPVMVLTTAPTAAGEGATGLMTSDDAGDVVRSLEPKPWATDRRAALSLLDRLELPEEMAAVWLSDGLAGPGALELARRLEGLGTLTVYGDPAPDLVRVLAPPSAEGQDIRVRAMRPLATGEERLEVRASAEQGQLLARLSLDFGADEREATALLELPVELRNRLVRLEIAEGGTAGGVVLLDERWRRRPVGLVSGGPLETAQPLLSDLYYLERALQPFSDVRKGTVAELLERELAVVVLADVGQIVGPERAPLESWLERGGVLVRFAGPKMAENVDDLIPVRLRSGGRTLGGAMSWARPARLAPFEEESPFHGLAIPDDVLIQRQVLAEPALDLGAKTWARLGDGTPLVTAERRGRGWLVLFHTTANTTWTNLPISGLFVAMLRRIVLLSLGVEGASTSAPLQPYAMLDAMGRPAEPPASARALPAADFAETVPGPEHPPGFYGGEFTRRALNVIAHTEPPAPLVGLPAAARRAEFAGAGERDLKPWLLLAAVVLGLVDLIASLGLRGLLAAPARGGAVLVLLAMVFAPPPASAQDPARVMSDQAIVETLAETRLAYVLTGRRDVDEMSRAGLVGLSRTLRRRTSVEPGEPRGVDVERDELVFFPLLYWPMVPEQRELSDRALGKLDHYMKTGGTIVFDTRDRETALFASPARIGPGTRRLRQVLRRLDVPPLIPMPSDHVLTKAFYLLQEFPGRWAGGTVWVEHHAGGVNDGVSSLIIGGNDWAGAWAVDDDGQPLAAVVPGGVVQRETALRFGVNLVMYVLTGNYKADQVHVPAILERLGQ